jgi:aerobic-type carbon monoxide dehydrogenase small subunit (CoxS/CutS family)
MTLTAPEISSFTVNGRQVSVAAGHPHLLAALREELGITSPKDGCSPSGQCGACTVLLDGKAIQACLVTLEKAEGKTVTTLEGFDQDDRDRLARAFAAAGALQCGFCTPGILVRTKALLDQKGSDLTRETAAGRLGAHLCRCTGYTKIYEAVELAADRIRGGA